MFFKKFFVGFLLIFGLSISLYGVDLSPQDKLSKTAQYLCENLDNSLCGINQPYTAFNDYHKT